MNYGENDAFSHGFADSNLKSENLWLKSNACQTKVNKSSPLKNIRFFPLNPCKFATL